MGGQVHAVHVHIRPEDADSSVDATVRLHALEKLRANGDFEILQNYFMLFYSCLSFLLSSDIKLPAILALIHPVLTGCFFKCAY